MSFVIHALPRCRTYWISKLLTYGEWHCGHDEIAHVRSMDDVRSWFAQPCTGTVETGSAWFWRLVPENVRQVVIRRPVERVIASLHRQGFGSEVDWLMRRQAAKLDQIAARVPGVVVVDFDELASAEGCRKVWEACLPYPFDPAWWAAVAGVHMERDVRQQVRYAIAHWPQMQRMASIAKGQMMRALHLDNDFVPESLTIQEETFETFLPDAPAAWRKASASVEERDDFVEGVNWPMMQECEKHGQWQMVTARCNGRIVGYLGSYLAHSLEAPGEKSAMQTAFWRDEAFPGLGTRLQRASVEALRRKGWDEVFIRDGVRASAPAMAAIARKLGGEPFGQLYRINLRGA